jgi:signal transduction histidine kinase
MSSGSGSADRAPLGPPLGPDDVGRAEQLSFFELGDADRAALRAFAPVAERSVDDIVTRFYEHLLRFPDLAALLREEPGRLAHLPEVQRDYFRSIPQAQFDAAYFESRLRVGKAHQAIGLEPSWYIGAYVLYLRLALRALVAAHGDGATILQTAEALVKTMGLDMALAMRTYIDGGFVARAVAEHAERAAAVAAEALAAREATERLKDELAAMIVHDLKNPVNGVLMMVQLALRKSADLPEVHRGYLQQIDLTCREMMRLIENLLEIAKLEEGKMPIVKETVLLAELVDDVAREYHPVAMQAGRTLRVDVGVDVPPVVADRALLRRVLTNLVGNAIRHSGSRTVYIDAAPLGAAEVVLRVRDHGRGIPAAQRERIFEKFATLRRSPVDEPGHDTGLGLPFCKLAVEQMGGRIGVDSTPGETVFAVRLARKAV